MMTKKSGESWLTVRNIAGFLVILAVIGNMYYYGQRVYAEGAMPLSVSVDGKPVDTDVAPFVENDRTYVPVRFVAEALGAIVEWNDDTQTVTISKPDTVINLTIDEKTLFVNNEAVMMDVAALIRDGRTFVPVRFVAEALALDVQWDENTQTVSLGQDSTAVRPPNTAIASEINTNQVSELDNIEITYYAEFPMVPDFNSIAKIPASQITIDEAFGGIVCFYEWAFDDPNAGPVELDWSDKSESYVKEYEKHLVDAGFVKNEGNSSYKDNGDIISINYDKDDIYFCLEAVAIEGSGYTIWISVDDIEG